MDTIFVENKPYYINKFDDFLELVRDKISPDAEKYIKNYISELKDEIEYNSQYVYTEEQYDDHYNDGYDAGYDKGYSDAIEKCQDSK